MVPAPYGRIHRAIRRFTLGPGRLRRRSDRVQLVARIVLVLTVALAPAPAAMALGTTSARLAAQAERQAAERHPVDAVLLADAARPIVPATGTRPAVVVPVRAGWRSPEGTAREGTVLTAPGTPAGATVQIWVGPTGTAVAPPLTPGDVSGLAMVTGVLVLIGLPLVAWALYAALAVALDADRARRWAREWAVVEPRWASRPS